MSKFANPNKSIAIIRNNIHYWGLNGLNWSSVLDKMSLRWRGSHPLGDTQCGWFYMDAIAPGTPSNWLWWPECEWGSRTPCALIQILCMRLVFSGSVTTNPRVCSIKSWGNRIELKLNIMRISLSLYHFSTKSIPGTWKCSCENLFTIVVGGWNRDGILRRLEDI